MLINSIAAQPVAQATAETAVQATYNEIRDIGNSGDADTDTVTLSERALALSSADDEALPMPAYQLLHAPPKKPPKPAKKMSLLDLIDYFRLMRPHLKAALLGQKIPAPDEVQAAKPPQGV